MIIGPTSHRCPVCGAAGCGPDTLHIEPIDQPTRRATIMANLKVYDVTYNGVATRMKLTEEDAERLGAIEPGAKKKASSSSKKRTAKNKSADTESS